MIQMRISECEMRNELIINDTNADFGMRNAE